MFDLLPEDLRPGVLQALIADIERRGMHLSTGFVGTPYLLHVLSQAGRYDIAYDLLTQTSYPSWLFPVTQGATTIWERWDGWTPQQGFQDPGMNSFNHYAFGSVGAWMVKMIGGLDLDPAHPGFKHVVLRPVPGGGLEGARLSYLSPYGLIISEWRLDQGDFHWNVCIPANSTARIIVPVKSGGEVLESGSPAVASAGISLVGSEPGCVIFEIGAGEYAFAAPLATPGNYTVDRSHSS
jgi:alpha-L-rhamnosidase